MKPTMRVVKIQQQHIICTSSYGVKGFNSTDDIVWQPEGFTDLEVDY